MMDRKLITQQRLPNGIVLSLYDHSHQVAGDRWMIKIECEAALPFCEEVLLEIQEDDVELMGAIRKKLGEALIFSVMKERNFVAEEEADAAKEELVGQVSENITEYLKKPSFPKKLFTRRYEECKKNCLLARQVNQNEELADDDGPADFSACFKD